jgi:hypothetical protein
MANTMTITANGQTIQAGQSETEALRFTYEVESETDHRGVVTARPPHATVGVTRTMPRDTGALTLLNLAVSSQRFNLLAAQKDKHPKGTFVAKTTRGRQTIDLSRLEIEDFQAEDYTFTWIGGGNDGLTGCTVAEEVTLIAAAAKVVNLADNGEAPYDGRQ